MNNARIVGVCALGELLAHVCRHGVRLASRAGWKKGHLILSDWGGNGAVGSGTTITCIGRWEELLFPPERLVLFAHYSFLFTVRQVSLNGPVMDAVRSVPRTREWTPPPQPDQRRLSQSGSLSEAELDQRDQYRVSGELQELSALHRADRYKSCMQVLEGIAEQSEAR
ncbi:hypothetical protein AOLI_G00025050 [Acnodon oligacanthus]